MNRQISMQMHLTLADKGLIDRDKLGPDTQLIQLKHCNGE